MDFTLRSLGYFTDLRILAFEGRVEDRGEYIVAETPDNPGYFWGNLLVMKRPPQEGDVERWPKLFRDEFVHRPLVTHTTFGWDSPEGEAGSATDFKSRGYDIEHSTVLTLQKSGLVEPKHMNANIEVRPLKTDDDWEQAIGIHMLCRNLEFKYDTYLKYKRKQMEKYRRMTEAGLGHWYGAFQGAKMIGDCGVYVFNGIGRYQMIGTLPEFRRQGVCGAIVYQTAEENLKHADTLVIAADPEYHAARVYRSVGFTESQKQIGAYTYPREEEGE